ncbi:hypothetical protein GCK72_006836 [Caenorhabditis remanei]|uniref:BTB domain-containing protein n=1 Tax=Caenorhabditis remanei TaxID=31234 RepID=A0A6A5HGB0_CAERE|nr:hypothetical protein GCK72_006836 [Caenorhabditis remanei]KAF1766878.1 hypothetical protein GCK72_006836 [Caenorhabditis remanei]
MTDRNYKISSDNNEEGGSASKRQRIEAENNQNAENSANNSSDSTIRCVYNMCQEVLENQKNMVEKLRLTDEKLESIQLQLKSDTVDETTAISSKTLDNKDSVKATTSSDSSQKTIPSEIMPMTGKYFVLKHVFKHVSEMKENEKHWSEVEEHFGVGWRMLVHRKKEHLQFYLNCSKPTGTDNWTIKTRQKDVFISNRVDNIVEKGKRIFDNKFPTWGFREFIEWDVLEKDFLVDGQLTAEIHVKIEETTGNYRDNLRSFDETMEEFSDVVLVVNEEKFYISKLYLAAHSPYFKALFLGNFNDSKKSEIKLTGIDDDDFQKYLEVLYGESAIDEFTVEGILMVADMYDTPLVIRKCEQFILKESKKSLKKKLQMAMKYHLDALNKQCRKEIKSIDDIKSVLPGDIRDLDPSIMAEFLEIALSIQ